VGIAGGTSWGSHLRTVNFREEEDNDNDEAMMRIMREQKRN